MFLCEKWKDAEGRHPSLTLRTPGRPGPFWRFEEIVLTMEFLQAEVGPVSLDAALILGGFPVGMGFIVAFCQGGGSESSLGGDA